MKLSRMQDIGGCRAIVPARAQVEGIVDRIEQQQWPVLRADEYTVTPNETGYRAVHVVVSRWGRSIEVQLRTLGRELFGLRAEIQEYLGEAS
jgi:ppGpp synthetase/RelA/SpoT-type nucleotidyltranferase